MILRGKKNCVTSFGDREDKEHWKTKRNYGLPYRLFHPSMALVCPFPVRQTHIITRIRI